MIELEIVLQNSNSQITVVCEIYDNPLSLLWSNLLKQNLIDKKIFKKHACFLGWVNNPNRSWEELKTDINSNLKNLHTLFPHKVELVQISDNVDSSFFNFTHQIFAELLGLKDDVSIEFKNGDIDTRWEIVKLNHLSHELQSYLENKKYSEYELHRPFLNCYFYNGHLAQIPTELNHHFTIGNKWGEIYLGSIDVGKNYYDAFNDNDDDVDDTHLMNVSIATGEFNIHFSEYEFEPDRLQQFTDWLSTKNVDINDKNLRIGTGKIGIFKCIKNYESLDRHQILDLIAQHDDVYSIKLIFDNNEIFTNTYDYCRNNPQIEIEQLA